MRKTLVRTHGVIWPCAVAMAAKRGAATIGFWITFRVMLVHLGVSIMLAPWGVPRPAPGSPASHLTRRRGVRGRICPGWASSGP